MHTGPFVLLSRFSKIFIPSGGTIERMEQLEFDIEGQTFTADLLVDEAPRSIEAIRDRKSVV